MPTIQRPQDVVSVLWRPAVGPVPLGTGVVVGADECVVASLDGAILGVLPPGTYALHPQAIPFLGPSVDASSNVNAELWFVRTTDLRGLQAGGPVGAVYDANSALTVTPRIFFDYSLKVIDPPRFVLGSMALPSADAVVAAIGTVVFRKAAETFGRIASETGSALFDAVRTQRFLAELPPRLQELEAEGIAVRLGSHNVSFSDEDREALKAATDAKARAARDAKLAEMNKPGGGTFPTQVSAGGIPYVAPPAPTTAGTGPAPVASSRSKAGLFIGLGVAAVVVLGILITVAVHLSHGGSHDARPSAPPAAKHGKH